jgi:DNA transformation protein
MSIPDTQISYILDQLEPAGGVSHKRMFGGVGFFKEGKMFGMLNSKGTLLLKVDESNIQDYQDRGMSPFSHKNTAAKMPYYEVPLDIIENRQQLKQWANKSYDIALTSK